jgi:putative transposase
MPSRNVRKSYAAEHYYHVYNRGVNKRIIFKNQIDYVVFFNLLKRYLADEPYKDRYGRLFPWLRNDLELIAFCLMPNHFHLCFYLKHEKAIEKLMRGVCTAYTTYFNKKYGRVGSLFQGIYKASRVSNDSYLVHISRYIHLNPHDYRNWQFSSLPYYLGERQASWIRPQIILDMFPGGREEYMNFLQDYQGQKQVLDQLKSELANGNETNI